jgi:SAM-dependent methyltransferase
MPEQEDYQKTIFTGHVERRGVFKGDQTAGIVVRIVRPYVTGDVLDIGAGSGALIRVLTGRGFQARGVDLYSTSTDIVQGSITQLPFAHNSFNTAFCCDVIEHLSDGQIEQGLKEVVRVLRPNGHFIVTTPFDEVLKDNTVTCPQCGHSFHRYGHLQSFTLQTLSQRLSQAGLSVRFMKVYPLGAMAKLPLGRYFSFVLRRLRYEFIGKSIVAVAQRR